MKSSWSSSGRGVGQVRAAMLGSLDHSAPIFFSLYCCSFLSLCCGCSCLSHYFFTLLAAVYIYIYGTACALIYTICIGTCAIIFMYNNIGSFFFFFWLSTVESRVDIGEDETACAPGGRVYGFFFFWPRGRLLSRPLRARELERSRRLCAVLGLANRDASSKRKTDYYTVAPPPSTLLRFTLLRFFFFFF